MRKFANHHRRPELRGEFDQKSNECLRSDYQLVAMSFPVFHVMEAKLRWHKLYPIKNKKKHMKCPPLSLEKVSDIGISYCQTG